MYSICTCECLVNSVADRLERVWLMVSRNYDDSVVYFDCSACTLAVWRLYMCLPFKIHGWLSADVVMYFEMFKYHNYIIVMIYVIKECLQGKVNTSLPLGFKTWLSCITLYFNTLILTIINMKKRLFSQAKVI